MGVFRTSPDWFGQPEGSPSTRPVGVSGPRKPPRPKPSTELFHVGKPWKPATAYELETGQPQGDQFNAMACKAMRGTLPCGRVMQASSQVCGQCGIDIARAVFLENDRHRDWCAEQITAEEYQRGKVAVEHTLHEQRRQRAEERRQTAMPPLVYYLRTAPDRVKIGYTTDLPRRLREYRSDETYLLAVEPGGRDVERRRHQQLGKWRTHATREDFAEGPEVTAQIEAVLAEHGHPDIWHASHLTSGEEAS